MRITNTNSSESSIVKKGNKKAILEAIISILEDHEKEQSKGKYKDDLLNRLKTKTKK